MLQEGQKVRVHFNLRTKKWVVSTKVEGKWKKQGDYEQVALVNAIPCTSLKGAERIRRNKSREVIARIEGNYINVNSIDKTSLIHEVHYNPYKSEHFTYQNGSIYSGSDTCYFPANVGYFVA
tara:strand:+ start:426 stop:791 length:366 start_codon:yes stop_codon:yes gene_type:complete